MATLTILTWEFVPLNPDGTDNAFLNSEPAGTVPAPTSEKIDYLCMGSEVRLILNCVISGNYGDSTPASVLGATIRYNPALFLEYLGLWYPPGTFPQGGYSIEIPSTYSPQYAMPLIGMYEFSNCNINGDVTIDLVNDQNFTITHTFRLTADIEQYVQGLYCPNFYRLSKNSIYADEEATISRPSVYGNQKGLNTMICLKQGTNSIFAYNLSIPFSASFVGYESDGLVSDISAVFTIERVANPNVDMEMLSPFEDNLIIVDLLDASGLIVENESEVILVSRELDQNISTYEIDFNLKEGKLVTDAGATQIDGAIYNPVTWSQAAGITQISFIVKGSLLTPTSKYQVHIKAGVQYSPSDTRMVHFMTDVLSSNSEPPEVSFDMDSLFYSRNGNNGSSFLIAPIERASSNVSLNVGQYNTSAGLLEPWDTFNNDIQNAKIEVYDGLELVFSAEIIKNADLSWTNTEFISTVEIASPAAPLKRHFILNDWRVPFLNYQSLKDWIGKTITFKWSVFFSALSDYGAYYTQESELIIDEFQNSLPSPYVTDIELLNDQYDPLSDWSAATSIIVTASIPYATANTYVAVMIDRYPLGVDLFNDFALEEDDPTEPVTPSYIIIEQKVSDLLINVPDQPTDNYIAFEVDVSELSGEEQYYIYIHVFEV